MVLMALTSEAPIASAFRCSLSEVNGGSITSSLVAYLASWVSVSSHASTAGQTRTGGQPNDCTIP